jgi:hypothetical protein
MDVPQLKLLAGQVRSLLKESSAIIGHGQALDLVAALPGLRNWPEVIAFPERVAACQLDSASTGRLAFRLKRNFSREFTPNELLSALVPSTPGSVGLALQVWPGGPPPGVYVTTSQQAISALMAVYEEATDGGLAYAERAGSGDGTIDLGEYGLWSAGIDRLPSGTLLVVGPVDLDQNSWGDAAASVKMACVHALDSGHRVAVLVRTPTPDRLCEDLVVLVQAGNAEPTDLDAAFVGVVTEEGALQRRQPFATAYPEPVAIRANADLKALPESTREALRRELAARTSGVILCGCSEIVDHPASDQLAAALALTEHAGPAARIMPRHRGTPAKDWLVPQAVKALPFLPSVESAYAQGYRRMIVNPRYSRDVVLKYDDVLFLAGDWGHDVARIASALIVGNGQNYADVTARIVAVLGMFHVPGRRGQLTASDLFVRGALPIPVSEDYDECEAFLKDNRVVRWQDELTSLLDTGAVTVTGVKKAGKRDHTIGDFLAQRRVVRRAS